MICDKKIGRWKSSQWCSAISTFVDFVTYYNWKEHALSFLRIPRSDETAFRNDDLVMTMRVSAKAYMIEKLFDFIMI